MRARPNHHHLLTPWKTPPPPRVDSAIMLYRSVVALVGLTASADAFTIGAAPPRAHTAAVRASQPDMIVGYVAGAAAATASVVVAVKKFGNKKEVDPAAAYAIKDPKLADFRSSLASMESLSGLSELKLEREEAEGRTAGVWKEYIKKDGKKWYFNTETKIQTWKVPDEIKKLDEISAAAAAKNEARGTQA